MIGIYGLIIVAILGILGIWWYTMDTHIVRINKKEIMEFKTSMELSGLPIITFYQGEKAYHFLLDTGSNVSYVNVKSELLVTPTGVKDVYMGSSGVDESCEKVDVILYRNKLKYEHSLNAADLNAAFTELKSQYGVSITGIIGCDFMDKYNYCIDFKEYTVYRRK